MSITPTIRPVRSVTWLTEAVNDATDHASRAAEPGLLRAEFARALWGCRDVQLARQVLDRARTDLSETDRGDLLAVEALASLFSGAGADTVPLARAVTDATEASPLARIPALLALTGALTVTDRGPQAIATARHLLSELDRTGGPPPYRDLAHALAAATGLFFRTTAQLPVASAGDGHGVGRPLLVGLRRHLRGDLVGAVGPLREAYAQQQVGEGWFRSEATAELIVVLAELGDREEARRLLAEKPPDQIAIIPGLLPWATAAVAAADGLPGRAGDLARQAARRAAARGAVAIALGFLTDAGRWGDPRRAAEALVELGVPLTSDLQRVRAADIVARGSGSPLRLLEAAEAQLAVGLVGHARELAELASTVDDGGRSRRRISGVLRQAHARLGDQTPTVAIPAPGPLTQRESEVAGLAARGLSDRQIAAELGLSVRTVHSHLASAYRKLDIRSRSELTGPR